MKDYAVYIFAAPNMEGNLDEVWVTNPNDWLLYKLIFYMHNLVIPWPLNVVKVIMSNIFQEEISLFMYLKRCYIVIVMKFLICAQSSKVELHFQNYFPEASKNVCNTLFTSTEQAPNPGS